MTPDQKQTWDEDSEVSQKHEVMPVQEAHSAQVSRWRLLFGNSQSHASPHPDLVAWLIAAIAAAFYIAYSVAQWRSFFVPSWDLGIFTQLAQQYAHVQVPIVDIKGPGYNLLGDHFHPLLVLLGPFFRLFPSGLTLLILQGLLFAWSSVPVTRLGRIRLGKVWGTLLGVGYVASWGLLSAVAAQFHEIAFAVPLLAFGLVHWLEGRTKRAFVEISLLVFVKEDLGLTVAAFGFVLLWIEWGKVAARREDRPYPFPLRTWRSLRATWTDKAATPGIALVVWGVFWFVASIAVILPLLNPHGGWDYTDRLSDAENATRGFLGFLTGLFGPGEKIVTLLLLVLATGIIGLRSPLVWLMVPTLAWRFVGNVEFYWGWSWHYSAILIPIAYAALLDGVDRTRSTSISTRLRPSWQRLIIPIAVLATALSSAGMFWNGPMGTYLRGTNGFDVVDQQAGQAALEAVGTGRAVVADLHMLAYVVPDNTAYWEGTVADAQVDTVAVGPGHDAANDPAGPESWAEQRFGGTWEVAFDEGGFLVLTRSDA
ncbi:MAG: DUF2079 domain-containing protein [Ancrocorticia sp.]